MDMVLGQAPAVAAAASAADAATSATAAAGSATAAATSASNAAATLAGAVPNTRAVNTGTGLTGGGDLTADRTLSIAASGVGATQLANDAVTNAKLTNMAANTIKGNNTGATGDPVDLTAAQVAAMLPAVVGDAGSGGTKGAVPAPAAGDSAKFLKGNGTWAQSVDPNQLAKAWVNFNATGVIAIRTSFNVSSITDNGVGSYHANYSTSLNANAAVVATTMEEPNVAYAVFSHNITGQTASRTGLLLTARVTGISFDTQIISVVVMS